MTTVEQGDPVLHKPGKEESSEKSRERKKKRKKKEK